MWRTLYRLVSVHPLVRTTLGSQHLSANSASLFSLGDLTQDLYLLLLEKGRFKHYLESGMTDTEIEREIFQIELTNFMIGRLRKRRPENYRLARRVANVLENDPHFRVFKVRDGRRARYRQAGEAVYGLRAWRDDRTVKDSGRFEEMIAGISMRMRDCRRVGCTGEAQVIITNEELAELLVEIFCAIDSPAPLRVLRQLALAKLPVFDALISSIDEEVNEERRQRGYNAFASAAADPERLRLECEEEDEARRSASDFLERLNMLTRANAQRTERLWRVLWHCYFDPAEPSQLAIAEMVGISDSSISDYRRKLETELRKLNLSAEQLRSFTEELEEQLRWRLELLAAEKPVPPTDKFESEITFKPVWVYPPAHSAVMMRAAAAV